MFSNQIHVVKMKNKILELLWTQSLPPNDWNLEFDKLPMGMEENVEAMTLFLSLEMEDNSLEKLWKL